ncbi:hypothetical protein KIPB_004901 [Kipferlia bialata]|uniref:Uncharacterized protein n=1 Tax=Kipferlia bialata TaxID=797122 RepID=A0A9K3CWF3_9EUKA|nr:hypothetical protein KIPB_004901 [Kipferlia bialata]|eukprot:g4901.t1
MWGRRLDKLKSETPASGGGGWADMFSQPDDGKAEAEGEGGFDAFADVAQAPVPAETGSQWSQASPGVGDDPLSHLTQSPGDSPQSSPTIDDDEDESPIGKGVEYGVTPTVSERGGKTTTPRLPAMDVPMVMDEYSGDSEYEMDVSPFVPNKPDQPVSLSAPLTDVESLASPPIGTNSQTITDLVTPRMAAPSLQPLSAPIYICLTLTLSLSAGEEIFTEEDVVNGMATLKSNVRDALSTELETLSQAAMQPVLALIAQAEAAGITLAFRSSVEGAAPVVLESMGGDAGAAREEVALLKQQLASVQTQADEATAAKAAAEKALTRNVAASAQFKNLQAMLKTKNEQIRQLNDQLKAAQ